MMDILDDITITNNELLKLIYPTYEAPKCTECGKEVDLTMEQIYNFCLVNHAKFLKGEFEGLCPECTQKWDIKRKAAIHGYNAKVIIIDELKGY